MFNVYKNQLSRQTGSRNPMGVLCGGWLAMGLRSGLCCGMFTVGTEEWFVWWLVNNGTEEWFVLWHVYRWD
jgi:hypothetical protein